MNKKISDFFGWYGMIAILVAYALISFSILESNNIWYQVLNVTGGLGLALISFRQKAYQPGILNITWAIVGLIAIINILI